MLTKPKNLTDKQWAFVLRLPQDWNQTQSYKDVYDPQMGDNSAAASASALLRNPKIRLALSDAFKEAAMSLEEALIGISEIARNETNDLQARLRAYEMIGRGHAAFTDKVQSEALVKIVVDVKDEE